MQPVVQFHCVYAVICIIYGSIYATVHIQYSTICVFKNTIDSEGAAHMQSIVRQHRVFAQILTNNQYYMAPIGNCSVSSPTHQPICIAWLATRCRMALVRMHSLMNSSAYRHPCCIRAKLIYKTRFPSNHKQQNSYRCTWTCIHHFNERCIPADVQ